MKRFLVSLLFVIILVGAGIYVGYTLFAPKAVNAPKTTVATSTPATTTTVKTVSVKATIETIHEVSSSTPMVTVEYPQFSALPDSFNESIATDTLSRLAQFRSDVNDNQTARDATADHDDASIPLSAYSFDASWQSGQVNDRYVSFIERYDIYSGGANEDQEIQAFNYDVVNHKVMTLADLFPKSPDYLTQISKIAQADLDSALDKASNGNAPTDMIAMGTSPDPDNFLDFTFTDSVVNIYFSKYAVAPGSFGEQHVIIARSSIK